MRRPNAPQMGVRSLNQYAGYVAATIHQPNADPQVLEPLFIDRWSIHDSPAGLFV
jgi:hypothetical protein